VNKDFLLKNVFVFTLLVLFIPFVSSQVFDSDGDGISDDFDLCPDTSPREGLPVILRNPEFLGCSCSQIFSLMEDAYCKDIFCMPNRPLEIRNRDFSSRPNPCPSARCINNTLFEYKTEPIRCQRGVELAYECFEVVTENSDICINMAEDDFVFENITDDFDIYDLVTKSYLDNSNFVELLGINNKDVLISSNNRILNRVSVNRNVSVSSRRVGNVEVFSLDISLVIVPDKHYVVDDFVFVERVIGTLDNKNLIINDDLFFDEENQLIVWKLDSLKDEVVLSYRITPASDFDFEFFVQGEVKSFVFRELILPLLILVLIFFLLGFWLINMREKSNVFKN
jgi:hypothetical protein